jgi:hypothetical protein
VVTTQREAALLWLMKSDQNSFRLVVEIRLYRSTKTCPAAATLGSCSCRTINCDVRQSSYQQRYAACDQSSAAAYLVRSLVEDARNMVRLKHLREAPASIRFVSFEPLFRETEDHERGQSIQKDSVS